MYFLTFHQKYLFLYQLSFDFNFMTAMTKMKHFSIAAAAFTDVLFPPHSRSRSLFAAGWVARSHNWVNSSGGGGRWLWPRWRLARQQCVCWCFTYKLHQWWISHNEIVWTATAPCTCATPSVDNAAREFALFQMIKLCFFLFTNNCHH